MWLASTSIKRPVFAVMAIGALVVLGFISIGRLGVDLFANIEFPFVSITTTLEGAAPDMVETEITDILEENVSNISGIRQVRSVSAEGVSQINIEFELDENIDIKSQDVRDKVAIALQDLPKNVDQPIVEKVDPDASPIMSVIIAGEGSIGELTTYADEVVKETIQKIQGVGSVTLVGGRKRAMRIWLDAFMMRAHGVTADDVVNAIQTEHTELPGGRMEVGGLTREFGSKTIAKARNAEEFADLVVAFKPNGTTTRIRDVARVVDGLEDERTFAQLNNQISISLDVRRQSGRNSVDVARSIRAKVDELRTRAPPGVQLLIVRDTSHFIESSISDVLFDIQIAIALVIMITFFFLLNWRATLIVALAIPTSLISTFFAFYLFDFTINTLTLLALTVAIGVLVDDAIVVIESIQRRIDAGMDSTQAALQGTERVGLAVLAGTFATLAVFVPIAFMSGMVGRMVFQFGLAIVFSVSVSLLVALTLTPMLSSRFLTTAESSGRFIERIESYHLKIAEIYSHIIGQAVNHRYLVLLGALISVIIGGWFASGIPGAFISSSDRSEFQGSIELPIGHGIGEAKIVGARLVESLSQLETITNVFITAGAGPQAKVNNLEFYVATTPKQDRDVSQFEIMEQAREAVYEAVPEASKIAIKEVPWVSGGGLATSQIEYVLRGLNLETINTYVNALIGDMRLSGMFNDVQSSTEEGRPEVQIVVDRLRAGDLGVSARALAITTRTVIGGMKAGSFETNGRRYDVRVRMKEDQRQNIHQLELIQVRATDGRLMDLISLADINYATGTTQIDRLDRSRKISVNANGALGVALGTSSAKIEELVAKRPPPLTMNGSFEGSARMMKESARIIMFAFVLAIIAVYMVLASQFNSFVQPLVIMLTAPLSFSGAFALLYLTGQELSVFTQIGLIALMGIVMKNGILIVDRANQLREEGASPEEAIRTAGPERLRPVLMTAFAAIFGMLPVALSATDGAEWRNAMGFLIIGGLASSTFLTLFVVPAAYMLLPDSRAGLSKVKQGAGVLYNRIKDKTDRKLS